MSKRYTPDHKTLALKVLKDLKWNISAAARYTNIPERTLREWHREWRAVAARSRAAAMPKSQRTKQQ